MNRWFFACVPVVLIGCGMVQEFGSSSDGPETDGGASNEPPNGDSGVAPVTPVLSWMNPLPNGNDLLGIWGTADDDIWLAGAHGTVARWDGAKASLVYEGKPDEELYAMWGSSKDDMWLGGRSGARGQLIHWDGKSWTPSFAFGERAIHALWGFSSNDVWVLTDSSSVYRYDGTYFHFDNSDSAPCEDITSVLRDLWGSSASDIWAVGDDGAIFRRKKDNSDPSCRWARAKTSTPGAADPFAKENSYFGIWGSSANDIWAVFVVDDANSVPWKVGFSHFDGTAWRVTQVGAASGVAPIRSEPARRGHRLWGTSANDILAVVGGATWRWNGTTWSESTRTPSTNTQYYGWTATWGSRSHGLMAVGQAGSWSRLEADQSWTQIIPATHRADFSKVSVAPDGSIWALSGNDTSERGIVRWTTNGWAPIPPLPFARSTLDGFKALSKDELWVAGTKFSDSENYGYVARFTNGAWGAIERVPMDFVEGLDVATPTNAWVVGRDQVARWDGTAWQAIPVPADEPNPMLLDVKITADAVWLTGAASSMYGGIVLRWDGTHLETMHRTTRSTFTGIWPNGPKDIWIRATPGVIHYDGSTLGSDCRKADFEATDIWGSGPDDVWLPSYLNGRGILRHWDGKSVSTVLEASTPIWSVSGRAKDDVWFVGNGGATLRYATSASKPPR